MADLPIMPLFTDALAADTVHLSPAEFGAYMRLLIYAWRTSGHGLPTDDLSLSRIVGDYRNWSRLKLRVMAFWHIGEDGLYHQKRLDSEAKRASASKDKIASLNSAKALKRWNPPMPAAMPRHGNLNHNQYKKEENGSPRKEEGEASKPPSRVYAKMDSRQWWAWDAYFKSQGKPGAIRDRDGGWWFATEWPPGHSMVTRTSAAGATTKS
jgi:uncharacterized protein YdaU (DUF1376 family)